MSNANNSNKIEYINKNNNIPTLPPHPIETPPRQPGEPSALEKLAAFAASIAAEDRLSQDRLLGERRVNDDTSDSGYTDSECDDDGDDDDDDAEDNVDYRRNNHDFFTPNLPFRMRTASLPAAIEGQKAAEVAQAILQKMWSATVTRRSTNCLVTPKLPLDN
ncbi:unnamed protein product [Ceratitis capitata]|uniref:(Mediterranean fruit fly) hypothetical protein n=1 Tax=Ceratitis capitata TaxID=7213 RepID=A0A811U704_CERCA|nr:unnamed protein product [Ceratitis capitata]